MTNPENSDDTKTLKGRKLTAYVPRPASQGEAKKKKNNIAYWRKTYGVNIKTHTDYLFFKANRVLILKCKPLLDRLNALEWIEEEFEEFSSDEYSDDNIVIGESISNAIQNVEDIAGNQIK